MDGGGGAYLFQACLRGGGGGVAYLIKQKALPVEKRGLTKVFWTRAMTVQCGDLSDVVQVVCNIFVHLWEQNPNSQHV